MTNYFKNAVNKHNWWVTILITILVSMLGFFGAWQFNKISSFDATYVRKVDSIRMHDKQSHNLERSFDELNTRQMRLEDKLDNVQGEIGDIKNILIEMNNK